MTWGFEPFLFLLAEVENLHGENLSELGPNPLVFGTNLNLLGENLLGPGPNHLCCGENRLDQ